MRANVVSLAAFQLSEFLMRLPLDAVRFYLVCEREREIQAHHYH